MEFLGYNENINQQQLFSMAKIEILPTEPDSHQSVANAAQPNAETTPSTLSFPLEGEPGEAVFNTPTVRHMKLVERNHKKLSITDQLRELGRLCLVQWGEHTALPSEDEIDAFDDQEMSRLMLRQLTGITDSEITDETLMQIFAGQIDRPSQSFEVLPDRSHRVELSVGAVILRRLSQKDIKRVEKASEQSGGITTDVLTACSVTTEWWGGSKRSIMPADFDPVPLAEFRRVTEALQAFLKRSKRTQ